MSAGSVVWGGRFSDNHLIKPEVLMSLAIYPFQKGKYREIMPNISKLWFLGSDRLNQWLMFGSIAKIINLSYTHPTPAKMSPQNKYTLGKVQKCKNFKQLLLFWSDKLHWMIQKGYKGIDYE